MSRGMIGVGRRGGTNADAVEHPLQRTVPVSGRSIRSSGRGTVAVARAIVAVALKTGVPRGLSLRRPGPRRMRGRRTVGSGAPHEPGRRDCASGAAAVPPRRSDRRAGGPPGGPPGRRRTDALRRPGYLSRRRGPTRIRRLRAGAGAVRRRRGRRRGAGADEHQLPGAGLVRSTAPPRRRRSLWNR